MPGDTRPSHLPDHRPPGDLTPSGDRAFRRSGATAFTSLINTFPGGLLYWPYRKECGPVLADAVAGMAGGMNAARVRTASALRRYCGALIIVLSSMVILSLLVVGNLPHASQRGRRQLSSVRFMGSQWFYAHPARPTHRITQECRPFTVERTRLCSLPFINLVVPAASASPDPDLGRLPHLPTSADDRRSFCPMYRTTSNDPSDRDAIFAGPGLAPHNGGLLASARNQLLHAEVGRAGDYPA